MAQPQVRLTTKVPAGIGVLVKAYADANGTTRNQVLRAAVVEHIGRHTRAEASSLGAHRRVEVS